MKTSVLDFVHRLLAESLYRGYRGKRPCAEEAYRMALLSERWFRELVLRLSSQCDEQMSERDPIDVQLWDALCDGRLSLHVDGDTVLATIDWGHRGHALH